MSKLFLIIVFISFSFNLYSHSDFYKIERFFSSYKLTPYPEQDLSFYSDSTIDNIYHYLPQHDYSQHFFGYANPGNPFLPMLYSERPANHPFFFLNNFQAYINNHEEAIYFDAQKPFTLFNFMGGAGGHEFVRFFHTQNANPNFNLGIDVSAINTEGFFMNNHAKVNTVNLFTAYTKRRYQSYTNFIFNKLENMENGGITSDSVYENSDIRPENMSVNLNNAQNTISQVGINYKHEYRFGSFRKDTIEYREDTLVNYIYQGNASIIQNLRADRYYRIYSDAPSDFYDNIYLDSVNTFDSTNLKHFQHEIFLNYQFFNGKNDSTALNLMAGIRNDFLNYTFIDKEKTYQNHSLSGSLRFYNKRHSLNANLNYCFAGSNIFDMDINARHSYQIGKNLKLNSRFSYELAEPDRVLFYYHSNHFKWDMEHSKALSIRGGSSLFFEKFNTSVGANINLLNNYIVFNKNGKPEQINSPNLVADAFIKNRYDFGSFFVNSKFSYQHISDSDYLPLPEFLGYSGIYFQRPIFDQAATIQTGLSGRYHSTHYAYLYMPATSSFNLQDYKMIGNNIMLSFHVAIQVRKFRGYVRASNFNSLFMPKNNYVMLNVPERPYGINFGVKWEFYD